MFFFFFNDTATTEIYTLSLHDALPISTFASNISRIQQVIDTADAYGRKVVPMGRSMENNVRIADRKSTRLNSSHANISYAVFCLKKKTHHYAIQPIYLAEPQTGYVESV